MFVNIFLKLIWIDIDIAHSILKVYKKTHIWKHRH